MIGNNKLAKTTNPIILFIQIGVSQSEAEDDIEQQSLHSDSKHFARKSSSRGLHVPRGNLLE